MSFMPQKEFNLDKKKNFSEWYNTIIYASDLVDNRYNVQGFVVHKPWSMKIFKELYRLFEKELEEDGHEPCLFPTLIPEENFEKEKEHVEGFNPNVFWVTKVGEEKLKRGLALRPTSETAFYQMYSLWIKSHADLPLKLYQSCTVFRNESETSPFLRGREFLWIETHDAFSTLKEAEEQVRKDALISLKVLSEMLGLPLMIFKRPVWDTFPGAVNTFAHDCLLPDGKVLQVGSSHLLGQNFSKAFGISFKDSSGKENFVFQTCFGPGIWRMMAALVSVHGDSKGLILPFSIAPIQVVIVPIPLKGSKSNEVFSKAEEIAKKLKERGFRCFVDSSEKSPGYKFSDWEMRGVPIRLEVGEKEVASKTLTLCRRDTRERFLVNEGDVFESLKLISEKILENLRRKAFEDLESRIGYAETLAELKNLLDVKKGFVRINLCSIEEEGKECAGVIQYETNGGKVRGVLVGKEEKPFGKCLVCGKTAGVVAYVARQY